MKICAIDIGTNSTRFLLAEGSRKKPPKILLRGGRITRLGEGLAQNLQLKPQAIQRTLEYLKEIKAILQTHNPDHIQIVGTCAARECNNGQSFFEAVENLWDIPVKVLSGIEEAHLVHLGAKDCLDARQKDHLIVDIGGGSTECVQISAPDKIELYSLPLGSVRLSEKYLRQDPPTAQELESLRDAIGAELELHSPKPGLKIPQLVGVAGTVTTCAAIHLGLERYDPDQVHGLIIEKKEVSKLLQHLASLKLSKRKRVRGLEPERADIIVAGLAILEVIMNHFQSQSLKVSDHGILYGMIIDILPQ